jgi:hypothetical protein
LTTNLTQTHTLFANLPFPFSAFMIQPDGHSSGIEFGANADDAILFACPNGAAQSCTAQVHNPMTNQNYLITMLYPQVGQTAEPGWANCYWSAAILPEGTPLAGGKGFGYCVAVTIAGYNATVTAYIIAIPIVPA